jgi:hypothetical protein
MFNTYLFRKVLMMFANSLPFRSLFARIQTIQFRKNGAWQIFVQQFSGQFSGIPWASLSGFYPVSTDK